MTRWNLANGSPFNRRGALEAWAIPDDFRHVVIETAYSVEEVEGLLGRVAQRASGDPVPQRVLLEGEWGAGRVSLVEPFALVRIGQQPYPCGPVNINGTYEATTNGGTRLSLALGALNYTYRVPQFAPVFMSLFISLAAMQAFEAMAWWIPLVGLVIGVAASSFFGFMMRRFPPTAPPDPFPQELLLRKLLDPSRASDLTRLIDLA